MFGRQDASTRRSTTKTRPAIGVEPNVAITESELLVFYNVCGRKKANAGQQSSGASEYRGVEVPTITWMVDEACNVADSGGVDVDPHACVSRRKMLLHHQKSRSWAPNPHHFVVVLLPFSGFLSRQNLTFAQKCDQPNNKLNSSSWKINI